MKRMHAISQGMPDVFLRQTRAPAQQLPLLFVAAGRNLEAAYNVLKQTYGFEDEVLSPG